MKINQNSMVPNSTSVAGPETESQKTTQSTGSPGDSAGLKDAAATTLGQQQLAKDAKSFSNLTADLAQTSLANQLPGRTQMLQSAAKELKPALPQMLSRSGNDPDQFMASVADQLKSTGGVKYKNLGTIGDGDIMAIAFLVMMEASRSAREDLKDIMDKVKNINQQKQTMREMLAEMQKESSPSRKDDDD